MKRALSLFLSAVFLLTGINITAVAAEESAISSSAENGRYTWVFGSGEAEEVYELTDEYAALRVSLGSGDSISPGKGIVYSGPSCKEKTDTGYTSAAETGRYILIRPEYSGTMYIKIAFPSAKSSTKGRIWYNDFGDTGFDDVDLTRLNKGGGEQIGDDFTDTYAKTLSFEMEAGHTYSLHTYVYLAGSTISEMYYESSEIIGKTAVPKINTPVIASETAISGTCAENASVTVRINGGDALSAEVSGTQWQLSGLTLAAGDVITVTAKAGDYKESDAASITVEKDENVCSLDIAPTEHGRVLSDQDNNSKILKGSTVTLTATPDDKYKLAELMVNGEVVAVDENGCYSFVINYDTEVSAVFEEKPYHTITMPTTTEHGSVSITGGTIDDNGTIKAVEGDRVTFEVQSDSGYRIKSLSYTDENGEATEFKYGAFFDVPASDVVINAEFKEEATVSYVDTSFDKYDRLTFTVDGEPFLYSGIQVRADNAIDQLDFNDEQVRQMYLQAGADGFTVVNSQVRWTDVQPDTSLWADESGNLSGIVKTPAADSVTATDKEAAYFTFDLPEIEAGAEYAAVKFRIRISGVTKDTAISVYDATAGTLGGEKITSPDWNPVTAAHLENTNDGSNGYFDFNVADIVNAHKNDGQVTLAVLCENESSVDIYGAGSEGNNRPLLKLSRDDVYDWTYLDKLLDNAYEAGVKFELLWFATDTCQQSHEVRVPYYVHENYQKSLKSDGTPARRLGSDNIFLMCKNDPQLRAKEKEVLETVFDHIAEYDSKKGYDHVVIGCQVANETAVGRLHSGTDENKYFGHCYCDVCMEKLAQSSSETAFREETLWGYLNNLASAVKESNYSVWTRHNNYMTTDTNVLAYNENKRSTTGTDLDFIGVDPYSITGGAGNEYLYSFGHEASTYRDHTYDYSQGKNLSLVMEYGGNNRDLDEAILACIAGGGWLNIYELLSGNENYGIYVADRDDNGNAVGFSPRTEYTYSSGSEVNWSEENWIERIRNLDDMLGKAERLIASKKPDGAGGEQLVFFNPKSDETSTSTKNIRALDITYDTPNNGVGIAIEDSDRSVVLLSTKASSFTLAGINEYQAASVETGYFEGDEWIKDGEKVYTTNGNDMTIAMDAYECVRITVTESIPEAPVIEAVSGTAAEGRYDWHFGIPTETEGEGLYNFSDSYASIRVASGSGDSLSTENGLYWSEPGCRESDSAEDNNRYILIKPEYSGTVSLTIKFPTASNSARGRIWYNDFGTDIDFDSVDISALKKGAGTQIGSDFATNAEQTVTFDVEAGHTYSLHTYNRASYISAMYYESEDIKIGTVDTAALLEDITLSADGTLSARLVYSGEDVPETAAVFAAVYSNIGELESVRMITAAEGEIVFSGIEDPANRVIKLFVWDTADGMRPLSRVYSASDISQQG